MEYLRTQKGDSENARREWMPPKEQCEQRKIINKCATYGEKEGKRKWMEKCEGEREREECWKRWNEWLVCLVGLYAFAGNIKCIAIQVQQMLIFYAMCSRSIQRFGSSCTVCQRRCIDFIWIVKHITHIFFVLLSRFSFLFVFLFFIFRPIVSTAGRCVGVCVWKWCCCGCSTAVS